MFSSAKAFAQPVTDQQLAAYYFQEEDFQKAALYYEKLYNSSYSDFYYNYYLQCLFRLEEFKTARKLVKNQLTINPNSFKYKVDLGLVYKKEGDLKKAEKEFESIIKDLPPVSSQIIELAKAFEDIGEYNKALLTFNEGDKLLGGTYPFNFEKAKLYGSLGKYEEMVNEYLSILLLSENYLQTIQNELARNFAFEEGSEQNKLLKEGLVKLIQKNPNRPVFSELLIWVYTQEGNYYGALAQSKALDKRLNEQGERVIDIGVIATSNKQFDIAIEAFEYIIDKGRKNIFYADARIKLMGVLNKQLYSNPNYSSEDLLRLKSAYEKTLNELPLTQNTVKVYRDFAHLQAFYLQNLDTAKTILNQCIQSRSITENEKGFCKLEMADILMVEGMVWDASLLYSQVDKSFKYDQLGEQAKFKNAKMSYYVGDFSWAKAQLDVLKGSTSKLIANDAMELSLLITDNTGLDSIETPLQMFARADLKFFQNHKPRALAILDSINLTYPGHPLTDEILMKKAEIASKEKDWDGAVGFYQKVIENHTEDITADDALFNLGKLYEGPLNDKEKAMQAYQDLMINYSNSMFVIEARKRFRTLRGDNLAP